MAPQIPCTCGCGKQVTYSTKINHLNGRGKSSLRGRVLGTKSSGRQQQESIPNQNQLRGSKKRASSNHDQDGSRKVLKISEPEENQSHETTATFQIDMDPMDFLPAEVAGTSQLTEVSGRTRRVMDRRWGNSRRDNSFNGNPEDDNDDKDRDNDVSSEDEDGEGDGRGGEDGDEYGGEDKDEDEVEGSDEDEGGFEKPELSEWDRLCEEFEREAAFVMGLSSSSELPYPANNHISDETSLGESDLGLLRIYTLKVEDHLSDRTFSRLAKVFPNASHDTLKMTKKRVRSLAGFGPVRYDCCINSCVCFVGPYEDLTECPNPNCKEARYSAGGKARKYFDYLPIIPRLKAMFANSAHAMKMRYRAEFMHEPGVFKDVFDGSHYQSLLNTIVPTDRAHPFFYFSDERDIALGLSTDGFAPFKRRDATCWPIILFNYNLPPELRFQKKYCIHVATVPGPKKPWDWDSFCWPLVQELIQLELGVKTFDTISQAIFLLHAYLILAFGDIPAIALIMRMKGQNGISPCRICDIKGVRFESRTNYVPLRRDNIPGADPRRYDPSNLPIRTHEKLLEQATEVEMAPNNVTHERLAKEYGIKGIPVLSSISSISFPSSFPFDFMHLIWENLIPNLIAFWTGDFKDLDHEDEGYFIEPHIWNEIGAATAACKATIPSAFGAPVPNIATTQSQMSAEMCANWTLYIAPIVLRGRFKNSQYYRHFIQLVELLELCLAFEISEEMLNQIDEGFSLWVVDYER